MHSLEMVAGCQCGPLDNSEWLEQRIVNIPSSVRFEQKETKKTK
jgi:hypothetical protein